MNAVQLLTCAIGTVGFALVLVFTLALCRAAAEADKRMGLK